MAVVGIINVRVGSRGPGKDIVGVVVLEGIVKLDTIVNGIVDKIDGIHGIEVMKVSVDGVGVTFTKDVRR